MRINKLFQYIFFSFVGVSIFALTSCTVPPPFSMDAGPTHQSTQQAASSISTEPSEAIPTTLPVQSDEIQVTVTGEVAAPGQYELPIGSTLRDAVDAAGGFTLDADTLSLALNETLTSGQEIHIEKFILSPKLPDGKIDINLATREELISLPGIGEATADRIIAYREANGPFLKPEDILNVPGLPMKYYDSYKDLINTGFTD